MNPHAILTKEEKEKICAKIREIESKAHTRIAIQVIRNHNESLYDKAVAEFSKLELHHPRIKTGILILISLEDRQFQILGDEHIHAKIGENGWKRLAEDLSRFFKEGKFYEGLDQLLDDLEIDLKTHFSKNTPGVLRAKTEPPNPLP
jgi:uncharacterized membrane protein